MDTPLSSGLNGHPCRASLLQLPRPGNSEDEYEDAAADRAAEGVAAVADGASDGIFSRLWAQLLVCSFVETRPDLNNDATRAAWLGACRDAWQQKINYSALRWSQQNKVERTGAAATFLALRVFRGGAGEIDCRAWAVGDSCLFWISDQVIQASFPIRYLAKFGTAPPLLRTKADRPDPAFEKTGCHCRPGDLFVLATDAVAQWLLRRCESVSPPDWDALERASPEDWRGQIDAARRADEMVHDDCTALFLRVLHDAPAPRA